MGDLLHWYSVLPVRQAKSISSITIVDYSWLIDAIDAAQPQSKPKTTGAPKKRPRIESSAKQDKLEVAPATEPSTMEPPDEPAANEPPAKKQKDGQKASSTATFVQLDDCVVQQLGRKCPWLSSHLFRCQSVQVGQLTVSQIHIEYTSHQMA